MPQTCRSLSLVLTLGLVLLGAASAGAAIEPVCYPDCHSSLWGPPQQAFLTLPGGCEITVTYRTRHACNRWWDVLVFRVALVDPDDPACNGLETLPIADVLDLATEQLLLDNPMDFPPPLGEIGSCDTNWRVVRGSCWSRLHYNYGSPQEPHIGEQYYPCEPTTSCCLKPFTVCINACGERTVEDGAWQASGSCSGAIPPPSGGACEPVCIH